MSQPEPEFNQDLELFKINLVAEEWRGSYRDSINIYMTALIALLAVELTTFIGLDLAGYFWFALSAFVVFLVIESPYFFLLIYRAGRRYRKKLVKVDELIRKVGNREELGDFETLMKDDKPKRVKGWWRKYFDFGLA